MRFLCYIVCKANFMTGCLLSWWSALNEIKHKHKQWLSQFCALIPALLTNVKKRWGTTWDSKNVVNICYRVSQLELHLIKTIKIKCSKLKHKHIEEMPHVHAWKVGLRAEESWLCCENSSIASISPVISPQWLSKYSRNKKTATKLSDDPLEDSIILGGVLLFKGSIHDIGLKCSEAFLKFLLKGANSNVSLLEKSIKFSFLSKPLKEKRKKRMAQGTIFNNLW